MIIAMDLQDILSDLGFTMTSIASRILQAMVMAMHGTFDLAILDMNVAGELSFPVAETLRGRDIPFIFASGYGERGLIEGFAGETVLTKPYSITDVERAVAQATGIAT